VASGDPDTGVWDNAESMAQGDAIVLAASTSPKWKALSLRVCVPLGVGQSIRASTP